MAAIDLLKVMRKIGFLSPKGFLQFIISVWRDGINILLLLTMAALVYGNKTALIAGGESLTYSQLKRRSETLAYGLSETFGLGKGAKTAFLCRNHAVMIQALFAASRTGSSLYLLNPDMSQRQFDALAAEHAFDLLIYDAEFQSLVHGSPYGKKTLVSRHPDLLSAEGLAKEERKGSAHLKRASASRIVLLTGGTTGKPKEAVHRPSLFHYLNPFSELMAKLELQKRGAAYIATPIFHGYGIAILLTMLALGKKVVITERFDAATACTLVHRHAVDVITVVPVMIGKMLEAGPEKLGTLKCIASGGAVLNPRLAKGVADSLGGVLFNLYGTSEAGLNLIAGPQDLAYDAATVGKSIRGTQMAVLENGIAKKPGEIGQLCVRNSWSMNNRKSGWIQTGDLGWRDEKGYFYLAGRTDDLIISGGINIYPAEIEQALLAHPSIKDAAVVGVPEERYGAVVKAFIQKDEGSALDQRAVVEWLRPMLAKYQLPRSVEFVSKLPYTDIGKLNRKILKGTGQRKEVDQG